MPQYSRSLHIAGFGVHFLTAFTAVIALYTLLAISQGAYQQAFLLMGAAVAIDAIDGTLARLCHVKTTIPQIDGALMDNMLDYLNYVVTPAYFAMLYPGLLPETWNGIVVSLVLLASAYQFCHANAKTADHFFTGFPCYWNILFFYMYVYHTPAMLNLLVTVFMIILVFVPIKYAYLSRMDYLFREKSLRILMFILSMVYGCCLLGMALTVPSPSPIFLIYSIIYITGYVLISLYRTLKPLPLRVPPHSS